MTIDDLKELFPGDWTEKDGLIKILKFDGKSPKIITFHTHNNMFSTWAQGWWKETFDIKKIKKFYKQHFKFENFK